MSTISDLLRWSLEAATLYGDDMQKISSYIESKVQSLTEQERTALTADTANIIAAFLSTPPQPRNGAPN